MAYQLFEIHSPNDLDKIIESLEDSYEPEFVIKKLKEGLDPRCKKILVETYYNDKDYRSTYYHYYSKKGYRYDLSCARLHFFDHRVELLPGLELRFVIDESKHESPSNTYFGYMVLRPTRENTIGRTVIAAAAFKGFHGSIIEGNYKVHLLGHKLVVKGFPYMSQHSDIAVCAHVACWSILRHYSERFSKYAEFLTYDITRMAHEFDPGGLLPSTGLHVWHAERVFANAGTYPVLLFKESTDLKKYDPKIFYRQLLAYVESGFPLFAELSRIDHAVAIIGHTGFRGTITQSAACHFAEETITNLVVIDDQDLPYRVIPRVTLDEEEYGIEDISAFIVPLPDKVYYPADCVDTLAVLLATEEHLGFNPPFGEPIVRYFLTTAAHLRSFIHEHRSQLDPELVSIAMQLTLPQFVWLIEIASMEQFKNATVEARVVVDATASPAEQLPVFLMHNTRRAYVWDRGGDREERYVQLNPPSDAPLSRMEGKDGNLETH